MVDNRSAVETPVGVGDPTADATVAIPRPLGSGVDSVGPEDVREELARITSSPSFVDARQRCRFLCYVVEEVLAGRSDQVNQYRIAVHALGRGADFDPVADPLVRTYANRLRRAMNDYYEGEGRDNPVRIGIPRGRYTPVFRSHSDAPSRSAEGVAGERIVTTRRRPSTSPTVAILPLRDLSLDSSYAYLSSGLTEELLFALTRYSELTVIGPLSRSRLEHEGIGPDELGVRYGARFVLDGGVGADGQRVWAWIRLVDTTTGANLWADTFERTLDQAAVPEILRDIGLGVLGATGDAHGAVARTLGREAAISQTTDLPSQRALLLFYNHQRILTPQSYQAARAALEAAATSDPPDAAVLAALSGLLIDSYTQHGGARSDFDRSLELLNAASRIDDSQRLVKRVRAYVYFYTHDVAEFLRTLEAAIAANPHTSVLGDLSVFTAFAGEPDRALELFERARALNPHLPGYFHLTPFFAHAYEGRFATSLEFANQIQMPDFYVDPLIRAVALGHSGRLTEANAAIDELLELQPDFAVCGLDAVSRLFRYPRPIELTLQGLSLAGLDV